MSVWDKLIPGFSIDWVVKRYYIIIRSFMLCTSSRAIRYYRYNITIGLADIVIVVAVGGYGCCLKLEHHINTGEMSFLKCSTMLWVIQSCINSFTSAMIFIVKWCEACCTWFKSIFLWHRSLYMKVSHQSICLPNTFILMSCFSCCLGFKTFWIDRNEMISPIYGTLLSIYVQSGIVIMILHTTLHVLWIFDYTIGY